MNEQDRPPIVGLPSDVLAAFLGHQRWFAGKGRPWHVSGVSTLPEMTGAPRAGEGGAVGGAHSQPGVPRVRIELVEVTFDDDGSVQNYQLPLSYRRQWAEHLRHAYVGSVGEGPEEVWVFEALHDKDATGYWSHGIAEGRTVEAADGTALLFRREQDAPDFPAGEPSLVIPAEQSNTSLIYGGAVILKVLRKVGPGLNPDIELHSALVRAGETAGIARPLGWLEGRWVDRATGELVDGSLAILQEFLDNATEGWEMAKTSVRDLFAEGDLHADEVGGDFAGESTRLGMATARVHAGLAKALPTAVLDRDGVRAMADAMRARLAAAAAQVPEVAELAPALGLVFDQLELLRQPVPVQRVHGDFHLGQVMRTLQGWKLLDFEGEPAKPLAERRALESPLKDVAGMLRSFDYAAHQVLDVGHEGLQREIRAAEWAERNGTAFCDGYTEVSGRDPRNPADGSLAVLRAFETDKAVYEVMYEVRHRPSWLHVPLQGVRRLAATAEALAGRPGAGPSADIRQPTASATRNP